MSVAFAASKRIARTGHKSTVLGRPDQPLPGGTAVFVVLAKLSRASQFDVTSNQEHHGYSSARR